MAKDLHPKGSCLSMASYDACPASGSEKITLLIKCLCRNVPQCPCSCASESGNAHGSRLDLPARDSQDSLSRAPSIANLAEHNRQLTSVHFAGVAGTKKAKRLNTAAQSLGIDNLDMVRDAAEYMEGVLPMEKFLGEKEQSRLAKLVLKTKEDKTTVP
jgi:hypothetical protein